MTFYFFVHEKDICIIFNQNMDLGVLNNSILETSMCSPLGEEDSFQFSYHTFLPSRDRYPKEDDCSKRSTSRARIRSFSRKPLWLTKKYPEHSGRPKLLPPSEKFVPARVLHYTNGEISHLFLFTTLHSRI